MQFSGVCQRLRSHVEQRGFFGTVRWIVKRCYEKACEIRKQRAPANPIRRQIMKRLLKRSRKVRLGGGPGRVANWINVDAFRFRGVDFVCDLRRLRRYIPPESLEAIFMSHVLEHFSKKDVRQLLADCHGLLKDGGTLWLAVPCANRLCSVLKESDDAAAMDKAVGILMGGGLEVSDVHRCAFTAEYATALLRDASFANIRPWSEPPPEFQDIPGGWTASIDGRPMSLNLVCEKRSATDAAGRPRKT